MIFSTNTVFPRPSRNGQLLLLLGERVHYSRESGLTALFAESYTGPMASTLVRPSPSQK
jgi:hypothetical protein